MQDANDLAIADGTVSITWKVPGGGTITQTALTNSKGVAVFTTTDIAGRYTSTVTDITKTGYTFDSANSVLTRSVRSRKL